jgi:hypothetical protein
MMKSTFRLLLLLFLIFIPALASIVFADPPGPPGPGGDPSGGGGGLPVGAPIDNGILLLLALGVFYGCYKLYEFWKQRGGLKEEENAN